MPKVLGSSLLRDPKLFVLLAAGSLIAMTGAVGAVVSAFKARWLVLGYSGLTGVFHVAAGVSVATEVMLLTRKQ